MSFLPGSGSRQTKGNLAALASGGEVRHGRLKLKVLFILIINESCVCYRVLVIIYIGQVLSCVILIIMSNIVVVGNYYSLHCSTQYGITIGRR